MFFQYGLPPFKAWLLLNMNENCEFSLLLN